MNERQQVMIGVYDDTKELFLEARRYLSMCDGIDYTHDQVIRWMSEMTRKHCIEQMQKRLAKQTA